MSNRDEVGSIDRGSDVSSRSGDNHTGTGRSTKSKKRGATADIPVFHYKYHLKEDHGSPLYGCAFDPYLADGESDIFATVGSARATVYRCSDDGTFKAIYCFADPNVEEFYTCTWLYNTETGSHVLAIGGKRGVIHLIPFGRAGSRVTNLCGHGQAINELMTHPTNSCLLLSGSKDHEMRLWNIHSGVCIAIFGGDGGHKSEVLTCDFDLLGERIVSSGMDHCIKIWLLLEDHRVDKAIQQSTVFVKNLNTENFPTVKVTQPEFSTLDVHKNYIDCVRWLGDTLISKSCETYICHWKPGSQRLIDFSKGDTNVSLLHRCRLPNSDIWFVKFAIDRKFKWIVAGNRIGKIFMWDLNALSAPPRSFALPNNTSSIRQLAFSPDGEMLIVVCDDGIVWRWVQTKN